MTGQTIDFVSTQPTVVSPPMSHLTISARRVKSEIYCTNMFRLEKKKLTAIPASNVAEEPCTDRLVERP